MRNVAAHRCGTILDGGTRASCRCPIGSARESWETGGYTRPLPRHSRGLYRPLLSLFLGAQPAHPPPGVLRVKWHVRRHCNKIHSAPTNQRCEMVSHSQWNGGFMALHAYCVYHACACQPMDSVAFAAMYALCACLCTSVYE